ncbi:hypothetical protein SERLA73DRAFT_169310 [Serpula lacrymans var. lacrymans S7.3]|uniref:Hsp90 chaperone protein kinase-targeting subunit n=2 Tax=Serpula lacrymans var. lacrymans TaxID=341189 RepID=F8PZJ1_SERL3|nr:uncharacterized protein SERLADRAFT_416182 [Serpula lacrymans var. lacrymans S7.9]EGN98313.1 hypothetical protein SERLA73DRAFT_169310 [Serpula lacrymans var. lacrymans S7.3]EGO23879.1 hypothetical protein SERLADRAFT_416182 [Serpula lacrymans var. lacrymans S7.9]
MPLNYSKWDQLELSDDSDIEGHPNVDKRSLIHWKQRDIHEKREARKHHIVALGAEIACNRVLQPRLISIATGVSEKGPSHFSNLVEQLQTNPSPDAPPTNAPGQPTYDAMILSLLLQIWEEAKKNGVGKDSDKLGDVLHAGIENHLKQLEDHTKKLEKDLEEEKKEQKKHITSEDIHEGFESKYIPPLPAPAPIKNAKTEVPKKTKTTATTYEVLNPASSSQASSSKPSKSASAESEDSEEEITEDLPELTPSLEAFSRLPIHGYEKSWEYIQAHRDVIVPGASDALLVAAFRAQSDGMTAESNGEKRKALAQKKYAKQCVHQSLLLQYCDKLGVDGVRVFFKKMISGDKRADAVFVKDVEDTYAHLETRVSASLAASDDAGKEQIQLVPENPETTISFNVPDGPPPEDLRLEGPGTENMDIEEVRKALQMRWDVFSGFSLELQKALQDGKLDSVNKVLGGMQVDEAEEVVRLLDIGGILNFADGGIRDETGKEDEEEE